MLLKSVSLTFAAFLSLATTTQAQEPEDCRTAAYANLARVSCYYDFDRGGNFLNYVIQIPPTGQHSGGWCKGIMDNIKAECGGYADNISYQRCDAGFQTQILEYPNNRQESGIDFNFHWEWDWWTGDDERACVRAAIEKATCAAQVWFPAGGCIQRS